MNLLLLQFNNYINRYAKRYETVEDYISNSSYHAYAENQSNANNFNPNDGIRTEHTINWNKEWDPDYLLCVDENNNIVGRWFVTYKRRLRGGQFRMSLKRDTVDEKLEKTLNSIWFVQKGFVRPENPLIFNKEDFASNKIKKSEELLRDGCGACWIIIYYNLSKKSELSGDVETTEEEYISVGTTKDNWALYRDYHTDGYKLSYNKKFYVTVDSAGTPLETKVLFNNNASFEYMETHQSESGLEYDGNRFETEEAVVNCINSNKNNIKQELNLAGEESVSWSNFIFYNNKLIKTSDNKFYRVKITPKGNTLVETTLNSGDLFDTISSSFKVGGVFKEGFSGNFNNAIVFMNYASVYNIDLIPEQNAVKTYHYDFTATQDPEDAPYGIIALPYKTNSDEYPTVGLSLFRTGFTSGDLNENIGLLIAQALCNKGIGPDKYIFDVQIIPYCPLPKMCKNVTYIPHNGYIDWDLTIDLTYGKEITYIADSNGNVNCISIHVASCKYTNNLYFKMEVEDVKLDNQVTFCRLCSPNWNGIFEFSPAKNLGIMNFNVDVALKPYQPYIHVNPDFKGLYGNDFNDPRGLICGGDFSLGFVTSKWEEYKLQNKNFEAIFDRQIKNMDVQHKYGMIEQGISAIAGTGSGALTGAIAGGVGGAIAGGVLSAGGGVADLIMSQKKFEENRSFAIDIHNYQLDNIKALPDSLSKVDAFNNNNKLFPILEIYSCSDEEKEIFKNKIKYEGMTVNAIGKLADYINQSEGETFLKGQIIRFRNDFGEDNAFANDVAEEIAKGVYYVNTEYYE